MGLLGDLVSWTGYWCPRTLSRSCIATMASGLPCRWVLKNGTAADRGGHRMHESAPHGHHHPGACARGTPVNDLQRATLTPIWFLRAVAYHQFTTVNSIAAGPMRCKQQAESGGDGGCSHDTPASKHERSRSIAPRMWSSPTARRQSPHLWANAWKSFFTAGPPERTAPTFIRLLDAPDPCWDGRQQRL